MPGLIEGASQGKGLGISFLRHIDRTKAIAVLIESVSENPKEDFEKLMEEMRLHSRELPKKVKMIVFTKTDLVDKSRMDDLQRIVFPRRFKKHFISAATDRGITELLAMFWTAIRKK